MTPRRMRMGRQGNALAAAHEGHARLSPELRALYTSSMSALNTNGLSGRVNGLDDPDVRAALIANPRMTDAVREAIPQAQRYFGPAARLSLAAFIEESGARTLYAAIVNDLDDAAMIAALQRFDDEWWLDRMYPPVGPLVFTVGRA